MNTIQRVGVVIVSLIFVFAGIYFYGTRGVSEMSKSGPSLPENKNASTLVVTMDKNGFNPEIATIKTGDSVEWVNKGDGDFWPASNLHPTHSLYPDSGIWKCGTDDEPNIFDSCLPIESGKTYSFTFNHVGEWRYHDHLRPNKTGVIRVE